jgi:hypothetical protein
MRPRIVMQAARAAAVLAPAAPVALLGAVALLTAAKGGDPTGIQQASDAWYRNANQIADFLHNAGRARLRRRPPPHPRDGRHAQRRDRQAVPAPLPLMRRAAIDLLA